MTWLGTATTVVALLSGIIGMALGIYNFIDRRQEKQRRVVVKLDDSGLLMPPGRENIKALIITAQNHGFRSVTMKEAGVFFPNGQRLTIPIPRLGLQFPHELPPGDSCDFLMIAKDVAEAVENNGYGTGVPMVGYYRDGLGTFYRSKPIAFDPRRFIE